MIALHRICVSSVVLLSTVIGSASVSAESQDPTSPSPQITALLGNTSSLVSVKPEIKGEANVNSKALQLTLRALVLRDLDHGTAIIGVNGRSARVIPLRREQLDVRSSRIKLGEAIFVLTDFSDSVVVLQSLDGSRKLTLK